MSHASKEKARRIRKEILKVQNSVNQSLASMMLHKQLLKGSLFQWRRRCGKPNCHCSMGEEHETWVFSNIPSENGSPQRLYLSDQDLKRFQTPGLAYKRFRQERASIIKEQKRLCHLLNDLEKELLILPPHLEQEEPR